jgi:hypothetical protein
MGVDLSGAQGGLHLNIAGWSMCLVRAREHGWEPAGTKAPVSYNEDGTICTEMTCAPDEWDGGYGSNDHQTVTAEDARNLSEALAKAAESTSNTDTLKYS